MSWNFINFQMKRKKDVTEVVHPKKTPKGNYLFITFMIIVCKVCVVIKSKAGDDCDYNYIVFDVSGNAT